MTNKEITLSAMRSMGKADALDLVSRLSGMTDTEIIDEEEKIPQWSNDKDYTGYTAGFTVQDIGQVYGLIQPHNASYYTEQRPADLRALWSVKHTTNPYKAKEYVRPLGTSGMYMKGECYRDDENVYISVIDNNVYTYEEYPKGWQIWGGEQ